LSDNTNKPDKQSQTTILQANTSHNHESSTNPDAQQESCIQAAGFTRITTTQETYYKCSSCHGTYYDWNQEEDPWKKHAQLFPYCPYVINSKSKFFVKEIVQQKTHQHFQFTTYYHFLNHQIRCLSPEILRMDLLQTLNSGTAFDSLQNLEKQHEIFTRLLQFFAKFPTDHAPQRQEDKLHKLQKQIECIVCMDKQRNVLIMPCTHLIACQDCIPRCNGCCLLCRTLISFTIFVLCS